MASIEMKKKLQVGKKKGNQDYQTLAVSSSFTIEIVPPPRYEELSDNKKRLIQTIWDKEQKRRGGKLHEGAILSALSYDKSKIQGQFVPYKYYLAQLSDPSLKSDLNIVPVSLNGLTLMGDNLVVGKRANWLAEYQDKYELAPSGGVCPPTSSLGKIDLKQQLLNELSEEVGIERSHVKTVKFFALIHDTNHDALELAAEIHLHTSAILSTSLEYSQVMSLSKVEIESFVKEQAHDFVPLSLLILKLRKLIA